MGIEDEISEKLLQGLTPKQIIDEGYSKSTVYKVHQKIKSYSARKNPPQWQITNIFPAEPRALDNTSLNLRFYFENSSELDLYLYRIGISTEWMNRDTWIAQEVKDLVKAGQKKLFNFSITVPKGTPLGEYTLTFGIEAQYMQPSSYFQQIQTQWSDPIIFNVKHPLTGTTIFLSHSTEDMVLVRQLQKQLDNYGYKVIIAEDQKEPGIQLQNKFESKIRQSTIFLALFTEQGVNSKWVLHETNYAHQINKPCILLREKNVKLQSSYEWTEFSRNDPPEIIFQKVMESIRYVQQSQPSPLAPLLGGAILLFLLGLLASSNK